MKTLIIYWSASGNTEKVAAAIQRGLEKGGAEVKMARPDAALDEELYEYDLVCLGAPSYMWLPPKPVLGFIQEKMKQHRERGDILLGAPKRGNRGAVFVTFSGPHTGIDEAIPAGKYMGQFFAHLGIEVAKEWYMVGEFHGREDNSTKGPMGDIRGRPNAEDLARVEEEALRLVQNGA